MALLLIPRHSGFGLSPMLGLLFFFLILRATAMDFTDLEAVIGQAVRDALRSARVTEENAADMMLMDLAALRRCLRGEGRLQLGVARLMRLPYAFWLYFAPTLMYLVAKQNAVQLAEDFGIRTKS